MMRQMDAISEWVIPQAGSEFPAKDFRTWNQPSVYVLLAENSAPLYVGMGENGILRLSQRKQSHWKRELAFEECDIIKLFPCVSLDAAKALETHLIKLLKPKYNERKREASLQEFLGVSRTHVLRLSKSNTP